MADPFWTDAHIAALKAAVASGVLSVSYNGPPAQTVTYQSLAEMRALLAEMRQEKAVAAGASTTRYATFSRGFGR